jgi:hypothetical protein
MIFKGRLHALRLSLLALFAAGTLTGCGLFRGWFDKGPPTEVRAFYVERQDYIKPQLLGVKINGAASEVIGIITDIFREEFDTTSTVLRLDSESARNASYLSARPIFKVVTPPIRMGALKEFQKYFFLGEYIMDRPGYKVKAEDFQISVDAVVKISGQYLSIEFEVNPYVNWNIYEVDIDGYEEQVKEDYEPFFGVGSYRYEKETVSYSKSGREIVELEWTEQKINDKPRTIGILENKLVNRAIELAALQNMRAEIVYYQ